MWHAQSRRQQLAPPLKERVFGGIPQSALSVSRRDQYKEWDKQSMSHAIKAIVEDGMSIRKAFFRYSIPRSTLGDRLSGRALPGSKSGPPRLLTDREESELENFLFDCSKIGYGKTRKDVMSIVNRFLHYRGINNPVSNGWWSSFCKRHPDVVLRSPASLARSRYLATNQGMLEEHIIKLGLEDKPSQIFNVDESGLPLNPKPPKTVNRRGMKNPSMFTSNGESTDNNSWVC